MIVPTQTHMQTRKWQLVVLDVARVTASSDRFESAAIDSLVLSSDQIWSISLRVVVVYIQWKSSAIEGRSDRMIGEENCSYLLR